MKLIILLTSLFTFLSSMAFADCFKSGDLKYRYGKEVKSLEGGFCTSKRHRLISYNCLGHKCEAYKGYRAVANVDMAVLRDQTGNPFHRKCSVAGGTPMLVEYVVEGEKEEEGVCFFEKDKSFISVHNSVSYP